MWIAFLIDVGLILPKKALNYYFQGETLFDTIWIPYGILFQEFHDYNPKLVKIPRGTLQDYLNMESLTKLVWTVATLLLMTSYGSNLRRNLIIQEFGETLKDLDELHNE